jgi:[acyl-carrier-protein] S-malonyltransferase
MWGAMFPGQGSQAIGMGKFLFENFQVAKELFEEAGDTLKQDFKKLCFEGPDTDLTLTENTQPALLLVSTATFRVAKDTTGVKITAGAGHSVGEYAAVVAAGSLKFADALRAVRIRGQEMQKAVPVGHGGMCAVIGLTDQQTEQLCKWAERESGYRPIQAANFNAPGQVVISGHGKGLTWIQANPPKDLFAPEQPKLRLIPLKVSAPFHCEMMKPAEEVMAIVLNDTKFANAEWPIVQNLSATETTDPQRLRNELIGQISGSVKWTQCMQRLVALGVTNVVEFGSGKVLTGLAKKIDSKLTGTFNINSLDELKNFELAAAKKTGQ